MHQKSEENSWKMALGPNWKYDDRGRQREVQDSMLKLCIDKVQYLEGGMQKA